MSFLQQISHYLPIVTTLLSAIFCYEILSRYRNKPFARQLLWWGIGVGVYGIGTMVESATTLFGWHVVLFKMWYAFGALLGGAPLAIGTVYLLFGKKAGNISASALLAVVAVTSVFVILSPVRMELVEPNMLSSTVLEWQKIRIVSPFVNGIAFLILVGGAIYSAVRFYANPGARNLVYGNVLIALGATLPGIGGMGSRLGMTELLYTGELFGIILIWMGYRQCRMPRQQPVQVLTGSPGQTRKR